MLTLYWILFILGIFHDGNGQNIRHGRTRYVSGKNQIYASGYTFNQENSNNNNNKNEIPFVHFWERPLQMLETSMNVGKKLSSRPLFSWDIPNEGAAFVTDENVSGAPTTLGGHSATLMSSKKLKHPTPSVSHLPPTIRETGKERGDAKNKEFTIKRSSFLYLSSPTKKLKVNRKKSINEINGREKRIKSWETNVSGKGLKNGKRGRKNGRRKSENKMKTNEVNETHASFPANLNARSWISDRNQWEMENLVHGTAAKYQKPVPCVATENICQHQCQVVDGQPRCTCFKGFTPVGTTCVDVNECETDNGGCNGKCINTVGSRKCICSPGFRLVEGTCVDVNECLLRNGHGPCQDKCINTVGSYKCSCEGLPGSKLSPDNHTCERSDECDPTAEGCSHSCVDVSGRKFCVCPAGFDLAADWKTCIDIDECSNPEDYNITCNRLECVNTVGSYMCSTNNETNVLA